MMRVNIPSGKYIVAVSGGVDSMVLLDLLVKEKDLDIVVAHFNHGIRTNADKDVEFVIKQAKALGLQVEVGLGQLGEDSSEEDARNARYDFLRRLEEKHEADSIITAHHQDDQIETALINIIRGTGPRGLVPMIFNNEITRPLLNVPKQKLLEYAKANNLSWVEDESNLDPRYLRNQLRHRVLNKMTAQERQEILRYIEEVRENYEEADGIMESISANLFDDELTLRRSAFILLPDAVASEVMARWLRNNKISSDRANIKRLVIAVKTAKPNTSHNIDKHNTLRLNVAQAHLMQHLT